MKWLSLFCSKTISTSIDWTEICIIYLCVYVQYVALCRLLCFQLNTVKFSLSLFVCFLALNVCFRSILTCINTPLAHLNVRLCPHEDVFTLWPFEPKSCIPVCCLLLMRSVGRDVWLFLKHCRQWDEYLRPYCHVKGQTKLRQFWVLDLINKTVGENLHPQVIS